MSLQNLLPPNIFELLDRAGIATTQQIMMLSVWDIKKSTNLSNDDILVLKNTVSDYLSPVNLKANTLKRISSDVSRISTGCSGIDNILQGGLRRGTITEVFGDSGCGKTQLALQITLKNWPDMSVYICTEDIFPSKRFEEIKNNNPKLDPKIEYGKHVFVEQITEANDLLSCIRVRLPKLLERCKLSLIVIDSVAAPFRCENTNYVKRAEDLRDLAMSLIKLSQEYNLAILCINQVTASFEDSDIVLPSLGLAWSNMVSTRLMIKKTSKIAYSKSVIKASNKCDIFYRELHIIFAPDLPNTITEFVITSKGIECNSD